MSLLGLQPQDSAEQCWQLQYQATLNPPLERESRQRLINVLRDNATRKYTMAQLIQDLR